MCCGEAHAADVLRIAVQKTGTFSWELAVIKDHGLDKKAGLDLQITELGSTDAGKIAIMGGSADIILSDWLWVSRERSLGGKLKFYPYSSTLGAVMVPPHSPINSLADLKGEKLAVAGGPLDKSWLLLQALAKRSSIDLESESTILYGAPPLLWQEALQRRSDATLNFWNYCADLELHGFRRLIGIDEVEKELGAAGPVAMIGYVFDETFAEQHRDVLRRFFAMTHEAQDILAHSDADWQKLAPLIGVSDPAALALYRKRYLEGIVKRPIAAEEADARKLYLVLAQVGGAKLVGPATELDSGTFYKEAAEN
ncbi:MAG TPA: ABC transporter substrate-binding protein [Methylovirgula sp.]|nr:ABC transporter substrate-binding protein [Methylovirgula sp.]